MASEPFRVLLVEDEPVICDLVKSWLESDEVSVTTASSAAEAIKAARGVPFGLILLDVVLPGGLDGIAVLRVLRSDATHAHTPIHMLTARVKPADIETARRAGADGYVQKPFKGAELLDLLAQVRAPPAGA